MSYDSYDHEAINLVNDQGQKMRADIFNTTYEDITIKNGIVGDLFVIYGNYDFGPNDLCLPGGFMLGISKRDDILAYYGKPSYSFEDHSLTYRDDENDGYWVFIFDDDGFLNEVMVHHQAYDGHNN